MWGDNRGPNYHSFNDLNVGRIRLGGAYFLTVSAWRKGFGATPWVLLQTWREVNHPAPAPVTPTSHRAYVPLEEVEALIPMLRKAVEEARSVWWVEGNRRAP
jgi:hypothetical protein